MQTLVYVSLRTIVTTSARKGIKTDNSGFRGCGLSKSRCPDHWNRSTALAERTRKEHMFWGITVRGVRAIACMPACEQNQWAVDCSQAVYRLLKEQKIRRRGCQQWIPLPPVATSCRSSCLQSGILLLIPSLTGPLIALPLSSSCPAVSSFLDRQNQHKSRN